MPHFDEQLSGNLDSFSRTNELGRVDILGRGEDSILLEARLDPVSHLANLAQPRGIRRVLRLASDAVGRLEIEQVGRQWSGHIRRLALFRGRDLTPEHAREHTRNKINSRSALLLLTHSLHMCACLLSVESDLESLLRRCIRRQERVIAIFHERSDGRVVCEPIPFLVGDSQLRTQIRHGRLDLILQGLGDGERSLDVEHLRVAQCAALQIHDRHLRWHLRELLRT